MAAFQARTNRCALSQAPRHPSACKPNQVFVLAASTALRDPRLSVTEIAHRFNFSETSAFSRAFAKIAGVSPRGFRKSN